MRNLPTAVCPLPPTRITKNRLYSCIFVFETFKMVLNVFIIIDNEQETRVHMQNHFTPGHVITITAEKIK